MAKEGKHKCGSACNGDPLKDERRCCGGLGGCACHSEEAGQRSDDNFILFLDELKQEGWLGIYDENDAEAKEGYWKNKGIEVTIEKIPPSVIGSRIMVNVWRVKNKA